MSRYGVFFKWISLVLSILFFVAINIDTKSILDDELDVYKNMKENNHQSLEQKEATAYEEVYDTNNVMASKNSSVPLSYTFAKIFSSFLIIVLAIILGITGRILAPKKLV